VGLNAKTDRQHTLTSDPTRSEKLSVHEPTFKCSSCNEEFYSDEVQEHARAHIDQGLLEDICKPKGTLPKGFDTIEH